MAEMDERLAEIDEAFIKTLSPWQAKTYRSIVNLYITSGYSNLTEYGKTMLEQAARKVERSLKKRLAEDASKNDFSPA